MEKIMEKLKFKSKRQLKDFEKICLNVYFDDEAVTNNSFGDVLISLDNYSQNAVKEVEYFIKSLNNKNIIYHKNHNKIRIS